MSSAECAYPEQSRILQEVFSGDHDLQTMIDLMRADYYAHRRESCVIWLGGKAWSKTPLKVDHSFFLESDDVGIGFSVEPEDSIKAAVPAYHPYQNEVIVMVSGEGAFEVLEAGHLAIRRLTAGDVLVLPHNQCHRFVRNPRQNAAYAFVKTSLGQEPDKRSCEPEKRNSCCLWPDVASCPLRASYLAEEDSLRKQGWQTEGHQPRRT